MRYRLLMAATAALFVASAAAVESCALNDPAFVAAQNDSAVPASDFVLMSIGLNPDGDFKVRSAKRRGNGSDLAWHLREMRQELRPHAPPDGAGTPFDMEVEQDTIMVFQLEPGAWEWERDPVKALFLKDPQGDARTARFNPFGTPEVSPGKSGALKVRFHASEALAGCAFDYNLGLVVRQAGRETPVVLDPKITNGGKS